MKSLFMPLLISLFILSSFAAYAEQNDWGNLQRYATENKNMPAPSPGEHRVVFMGNSITEGWVNCHPDFFKKNNYIGRGISGQTSPQMLLRFRQDVINLHPDVVVINSGTNDCAENTGPFDIEATFGNIKSMVELAKANGISVILTSVLPAAYFGWNKNVTDAADRISALNEKIQDYARINNIPYVDYYSVMVEGPERALNQAYTSDGVHPTSEGYDVMETMVNPIIENTIRK